MGVVLRNPLLGQIIRAFLYSFIAAGVVLLLGAAFIAVLIIQHLYTQGFWHFPWQ